MHVDAHILTLDYAAEARRLADFLAETVARRLNRRGVVLGVSGGVDSAVCASLAVRALGADRVFALLMPERDSGAAGTARALGLCRHLGIAHAVEDITDTLTAVGCYDRRDAAIARLVPEYRPGCRHKITISGGRLPYFNLVVETSSGELLARRMPADVYLQVVAATNFKQRVRKTLEYYHADRLNYAVLGTPNRLEYALGFFVRGGDGLADVKPIAHLYKTQVYGLAAHLGVPEEIRAQPPSTDTYSLPQTQEEFYFALPYHQADLALYGLDHGIPAATIAAALGLDVAAVERVGQDFLAKRKQAARALAEALVIGKDG